MGICLDTEQQNGSQVFEDGDRRHVTGRWQGEAGLLATPPDGHFPMQNIGQVKFHSPKVPVIFVLGGPGSGKVTHCDNLIHEKKGITHINMTDLLQQYAMGNDMLDFGLLSSKTVTEVLMLEMKMSPNAKTFLVSGYPRNMRDVVEYSEKIQIVNGVVLVSWRQEILERQIDYGAQLGHVILGLARMELHNFYRNVMPVAEYFDQSGMLIVVNGERNPSEVYVDFRAAVMKILGVPPDGGPLNNVPGSVEAEVQVERAAIPTSPPAKENLVQDKIPPVGPDMIPVIPDNMAAPIENHDPKPTKTAVKPRKGLPAFIWVIGGPGSNKAALIDKAIDVPNPNWVHFSVGGLLRNLSSTNPIARDAITAGEMVPGHIVMQLIEQQVLLHRDSDGIVIDGFPRDSSQVDQFEQKFGQEPPLLLLDCSKLQLGRGRLDDSVSAFRRRLELFRELSLPMLKSLDGNDRLTIVDGDTDTAQVQQEFTAALREAMQKSARGTDTQRSNGGLANGYAKTDQNHGGTAGNGVKPNYGIANGVGQVAKQIANSGAILAKGEATRVVQSMINASTEGARETRNPAMNAVTKNVNGIKSTATKSFNDIKSTAMSNAANSINDVKSSTMNSVSKGINDVKSTSTSTAANSIRDIKSTAMNSVSKSVGNVKSTAVNTAVRSLNDVKSTATKGVNDVKSTTMNGTSNVINSISKQVQDQVDNRISTVANGTAKMISNGVPNHVKANGMVGALQNGAVSALQNGVVPKLQNGNAHVIQNGIVPKLQNGAAAIQNGVANGIGHLVNGHLPANRVAPIRNFMSNGVAHPVNNNATNTVKNMYNEVEGYQNDLHI